MNQLIVGSLQCTAKREAEHAGRIREVASVRTPPHGAVPLLCMSHLGVWLQRPFQKRHGKFCRDVMTFEIRLHGLRMFRACESVYRNTGIAMDEVPSHAF